MRKIMPFGLWVMMLIFFLPVYAGTLIPAVNSSLYYEIGGGESVPLPAFYSTSYVPLRVESEVGLGFNCGAFNPVASLKNSLNQIKSSFLALKQQVIHAATAAVTELPLYELSRVDPNLYNLLTDAMVGAQNELALSTKSCESMQSEIAAGQNPYAHWGSIALGSQWQQQIGTAAISGEGDINQAHTRVSHDAGKSGIPWVNPNGNDIATVQHQHAGGIGQTPIHVIYDSAMAGYQWMISNTKDRKHLELKNIFPNKKSAAHWLVGVVGDQTITTYGGGPKNSQPGVGVYPDIQEQMETLLPKLQAIVNREKKIDLKTLQAVSVPNMALTPEIFHSIQGQPQMVQAIIVRKLAQHIAAMLVMNKVRFSMQILRAGAKVPAIYSNAAAQKMIKDALLLLRQSLQDILFFVKVRDSLMSHFLATVLQAGEHRLQTNNQITMPAPQSPLMNMGAFTNASKAS